MFEIGYTGESHSQHYILSALARVSVMCVNFLDKTLNSHSASLHPTVQTDNTTDLFKPLWTSLQDFHLFIIYLYSQSVR